MSENTYKPTLLEIYFPKTFDDLILPKRIKLLISQTMQTRGYRILLHSTPGTGKTTTANLMVADRTKISPKFYSGSNRFLTETYENVLSFASNASVFSLDKTVIIDEAENIDQKLQEAFKKPLDVLKQVNFIFITNNLPEINEAIFSRCTIIDYNFSTGDLEEQKANFIQFALRICKEQNIPYTNKGLKSLFILNFPDFRHLLINMQQIIDTEPEGITEDNVKKLIEMGRQMPELYAIIENPALIGKDLYTELTNFKGKEKECLISLGEPFFTYLNDKGMYNKTLEVANSLSKYYDSYNNSINKFVTFVSCVNELKSLFR